ncbi:Synaptic vesicle transporter SVOP and related transporters (major facilitator superfamily) [Ceraceosorus bombacis]|uniref:Synaptic vesicle transporter SVOP and related transporters (Major facilitator superfamily) n=1 Tax=Ceraceosorus bombacis TaxID=401625 RepID=A0A0P1BAF8_9BASI|nr:Synaptic vesicle transporter SVOP and related transporters (major facilitator superfamily) [Ceraceosorus bombacis]
MSSESPRSPTSRTSHPDRYTPALPPIAATRHSRRSSQASSSMASTNAADVTEKNDAERPVAASPATTSNDHLEGDNEKEELKEDSPKAEAMERRQPSTTFHEPPVYRAPGESGAIAASRTFSARTPSRMESAHPFGGDLGQEREELELERFKSQAGKDQVIVHWEGADDPENPQNWSNAYKAYLTIMGALLVLNSTFTSSAPSGIVEPMIAYFQFSSEVATLTISLWVAGYCLGPLIWGPLSERVGRRPVFIISIFAYTCWNIGCALSKNTAQILVFRFLGGTFGAAPLTNSGGVIADVWGPKQRGIALCFFSVAPFAGPAVGPIVSGAIAVTNTDWRWVYWVCAIFSGVCLVITIFTFKETYAPAILKKKAQRIRKETSDDNFVYGLIYLQFESVPIVFVQGHGFNSLVNGLMFIPLFLGGVAGCLFYVFFTNPKYTKLVDEYAAKGQRVPPEKRLDIVCIAAPCLVVSFFWLGWTSYPSISFWAPMMSLSLLGFAVLLIFLGLFNYIIDSYLAKAASALASNTVMRSAFGAGFPLFAAQMYARLGTQWASSLLGFLALLMLPIPFVLVKYGPSIRKLSKHSAE